MVKTVSEWLEQKSADLPLVNVKGIGKGTVENLKTNGINSISELLEADPKELSEKLSGASVKKSRKIPKRRRIEWNHIS